MANPYKLLMIVTRFRVLNITILGCRSLITILPVRSTGKQNQFPVPARPDIQNINPEKVQVIHVFLFDKHWKIVMHITLFKVPQANSRISKITNSHAFCLGAWFFSLGSLLTTYDLLLTTI
jgi:hypothetical protein